MAAIPKYRQGRLLWARLRTLTHECGACIGWYDWVVLEDDVEGCGGYVPPAEMNQITFAIANDLKIRLSAKAGRLNTELLGIHEILASLIGEP